MRVALSLVILSMFAVACRTTAGPAVVRTEVDSSSKTLPPQPATHPTADFGQAWKGVTVQVSSTGDAHGLGKGMAEAVFAITWTEGQGAGVLYPKKFVDTATKQEVPMNFLWDVGGDIKAGTYDILVEHDGRLGKGWLRNVRLEGPEKLRVVVDMNACMLDLPLGTYREVVVYPAGTYADYEARGMADAIPDELAITWYDAENRGVAGLAPGGIFDLKVVRADGRVEWRQRYTLRPNSKLKEL